MSDTNKWDLFDEELLITFDCSLKGPIQRSQQAFSDITYAFCNEIFGTEEIADRFGTEEKATEKAQASQPASEREGQAQDTTQGSEETAERCSRWLEGSYHCPDGWAPQNW